MHLGISASRHGPGLNPTEQDVPKRAKFATNISLVDLLQPSYRRTTAVLNLVSPCSNLVCLSSSAWGCEIFTLKCPAPLPLQRAQNPAEVPNGKGVGTAYVATPCFSSSDVTEGQKHRIGALLGLAHPCTSSWTPAPLLASRCSLSSLGALLGLAASHSSNAHARAFHFTSAHAHCLLARRLLSGCPARPRTSPARAFRSWARMLQLRIAPHGSEPLAVPRVHRETTQPLEHPRVTAVAVDGGNAIIQGGWSATFLDCDAGELWGTSSSPRWLCQCLFSLS